MRVPGERLAVRGRRSAPVMKKRLGRRTWLAALDYLFVARPVLWFPGWATLLAGLLVASGRDRLWPLSNLFQPITPLSDYPIWLALWSFTSAMAGCFILNQLEDVESDRANGKLFLIGYGFVSRRAGWVEALVCLSVALGSALAVSFRFFLLCLAFILVTGYLYNFAPFRFKNRPLWGLWANMAMGWFAFALGWAVAQPVNEHLLVQSLPFVGFNSALYLLTTLPDMKGDSAQHKITFPLRFGLPPTLRTGAMLVLLGLGIGLVCHSHLMLVGNGVVLPAWLFLMYQFRLSRAIVVLKCGILLLMLLVALKVPLFAPLTLAVAALSRYYYKNRFHLTYPTLSGS